MPRTFFRKFLNLFGLAVLAFALAGCGTRERAVDVAIANDTLLIGNGSEPKSLDPHLVTGVPENRLIQGLIEGLIAFHPTDDLLPEPGVAESWEHNDDFTEWTFKLRDDAKWSNGDPVTAGDFVYSWQRILSPVLGSEYAEMLYVLKGGEAFHKGETTDFSTVGVKAPDDRTLNVSLAGSTPYFLNMLKHYSFYPVNPQVVEKFGGMLDRNSRWSTLENYVGNGPFVLKEWKTNQVIRMTKSPTYWDADRVKLKQIDFFPIDNVASEETAYRGGQLHMTSTVSPDKIPMFQEKFADQLRIDPYLGSYFFRINVTRKPFDNPLVRRALNLALDRQLLVDRVTKGGQAPATGFVPPGMSTYEASTAVGLDVKEARRLLAVAGYPGGKGFPKTEILINTSESHRKVAEATQAMWRKNLGINVGIYNQEWKVYLDSQSNLDFDLVRAGWIADYAYPMTFLSIFTAGNGNNDTGWANPQYDALIQRAQDAESEESRIALMHQAEAILMDELPIVPIYWYTRVYLKDPRVKGWDPVALDNHPYKYVYFDK